MMILPVRPLKAAPKQYSIVISDAVEEDKSDGSDDPDPLLP